MPSGISVPTAPQGFTPALIPALHRVSRRQPCPICDHADWCEIRDDGAVHCMRVESPIAATRQGGWWHRIPTAQNSYSSMTNIPTGNESHDNGTYADSTKPEQAGGIPIASVAVRDQIYRSLLEKCRLTHEDQVYLQDCRIDRSYWHLFGSLPARCAGIVRDLVARFGKELILRVPGFVCLMNGEITLAAGAGVLLAVCDQDGAIIAMQVRSTAPASSRYKWLSSSAHAGPSSSAPAHVVPAPSSEKGWINVWITEGIKKAYVASQTFGVPAIALQGHTTHQVCLDAVDAIMACHRVRCVTLALDQDANAQVRSRVDASTHALVQACRDRGLAVEIATWDPALAKGIDDLILAGDAPALDLVVGACMPTPSQDGKQPVTGMLDALRAVRAMQAPPLETTVCEDIVWQLAGIDVDAPAQVVPIAAIAARCSVAPATASKAVHRLESAGILRLERRYDTSAGGDPRLIYAMAFARTPHVSERLPDTHARIKDRARARRCVACGSTRLTLRCEHCGVIQQEEGMCTPLAGNEEKVSIASNSDAVYRQHDAADRADLLYTLDTLYPALSMESESDGMDKSVNWCTDHTDPDLLPAVIRALKGRDCTVNELCGLTGAGMSAVFRELDGLLERRQAHMLGEHAHQGGNTYRWGMRPKRVQPAWEH